MFQKKCVLLVVVFFHFTAALGVTSPRSFDMMVVNDIHLNVSQPHAMSLTPSSRDPKNDMDVATFSRLINTTKSFIRNGLMGKVDTVLLLGDCVGHRTVPQRFTAVTSDLTSVFSNLPAITFASTASAQWIYSFGNNDSLSADYGPFVTKQTSPWTVAEHSTVISGGAWGSGFYPMLLDCNKAQGKHWPCQLHPSSGISPSKYGLSVVRLHHHLELINFNDIALSMLAHRKSSLHTPAVLAWLNKALADAELNGNRVIISMHIPLGQNVYDGSQFLSSSGLSALLAILHRYHHSIVALLSAHTHMTEFKVIRYQNHPLIAQLISPGMSTSHGNAASFSLYHFTQDSNGLWQLMNMKTFRYASLNKVIAVMNMRSAYGCPANLSLPQCLFKKTLNMKELTQRFSTFYLNGNPHLATPSFDVTQLKHVFVDI